MHLLCTYTAYLLRKLCRFFIRIQLFVRVDRLLICIRIIVRVEQILIWSWGFFDFLKEQTDDPILRVLWFAKSPDNPILRVLWFPESLDNLILRVLWFPESPCKHSWLLDRLDDTIFKVPLSSLSDDLHVMIGLSVWSDIEGSIELFIWRSARNSLSDLTWSISYSKIFSQFTVWYYLRGYALFFVAIDRSIYLSRWSNITVHYDTMW